MGMEQIGWRITCDGGDPCMEEYGSIIGTDDLELERAWEDDDGVIREYPDFSVKYFCKFHAPFNLEEDPTQ